MFDALSNILDYFFHKKCYFCQDKTESVLMCEKCYEKIKSRNVKIIKNIDGIKIQGFFLYKDEILRLIRGIKYHNKKELAVPIAKMLKELSGIEGEIELVPVPLHEKRQKKRKYNHMELIADNMGFGVNTGLIKRVKDTIPQYQLSQKQRKENLQGAFRVYPENYSGKKLVLLDDICTTGSTIREISKELRSSGIYNIESIIISFVDK